MPLHRGIYHIVCGSEADKLESAVLEDHMPLKIPITKRSEAADSPRPTTSRSLVEDD
jgi:hypothetical protein